MKKQNLVAPSLLAFALTLLAACTTPVTLPTAPPSAAATRVTPASTPTAQATPVPTATATSTPSESSSHPNLVFILTDDQDTDSLKFMPKLKALLTDQGTSFSNYFLNVSLCCPSRTSILRGQYAHNTQISGNAPPEGGFQRVYSLGLEKATVATWLQSADYRTALLGKYLNGYPISADQTYIPPGWSEWYSPAGGTPYDEFNYKLNENGKIVTYGNKPEDYGTDVYSRKAINFIQRATQDGKPFFIYLATYAPHSPATPAPRHQNLFADAKAPRPPSFNEDDVSDKPTYLRTRPKLTDKEIATIDADYRKRLQSLQAVDEMISNLVDVLKAAGQLDNTYIFFTSDNGFHLGHHRLAEGKQAPYEEDIRVPLIVRGPGVPAGRSVEHLTGNIDLAPTWAELAGVKAPDFVDGRSLVPLIRSNPPPLNAWRQAFLIQHGAPKTTASLVSRDSQGAVPTVAEEYLGLLEPPDAPADELNVQLPERGITPFQGIRTQDYTYVEYTTGERELYDLRGDSYQLQNMATTAKPDLLKELSARLAQLRQCAGASCRAAEDAPLQVK